MYRKTCVLVDSPYNVESFNGYVGCVHLNSFYLSFTMLERVILGNSRVHCGKVHWKSLDLIGALPMNLEARHHGRVHLKVGTMARHQFLAACLVEEIKQTNF